MDITTIFKIASTGLVVSMINIILTKSGRDEYTIITTLSGIIIALAMIIDEIKNLFNTLESLFKI